MKLEELFSRAGTITTDGDRSGVPQAYNPEINAITCRAQDVTQGDIFVAIKGFAADGHDYIDLAVAQGASVIVCEQPAHVDAVTVTVENSRKALAQLAAAYYGHPSGEMLVIGLTGTNGKTTTSYLIESILQKAGLSVGVIGTINYRYGGRQFDNPITTPESLDLQRILYDMRAAGVTHVVMEVSSHALDLHRVHKCQFDLAVFTNFTQDHLDYHQSMDAYWECKRKLFIELLPAYAGRIPNRAVLNVAVPKGRELAREMELPFLSCGDGMGNDLNSLAAQFNLNGIQALVSTPAGELSFFSPLVGRHNLENIIIAAGVGIALEIPPETITAGIESLEKVSGRLERVANPYQRFVYVDYAHTPDALENSLLALRSLTADRIICVFGCGGDRDRGKRPKMGAIAGRLSDLMVITSDNPRTEAPEKIIDDIVEGVLGECDVKYTLADLRQGFKGKGCVAIVDRREAIYTAAAASRPGDTLLIAGKGHEPYQIVGARKKPFDDRLIAQAALAGLK
jgi:UDP-N-acetylmuramyl-tripeptide synthetase